MNRKEIAPGVYITSLPGDKFKRCLIVFHFVVPGDREQASDLAVLPHVLERRCENIPDPLALSRRLFDLYGADLSADSYMAGPNRVLTFAISGLKNTFSLEGENLEQAYVSLLCDCVFGPKLKDGVFEQEDLDIEREKQIDYLRSEKNNKRSYCLRQARRKLYGDSVLGIESGGYLEDMDSLSPQSLYRAYAQMLSRAQLDIIVCGTEAEKAAGEAVNRLSAVDRNPASPAERLGPSSLDQYHHYEESLDSVQGKLCILCTIDRQLDQREEAVMRVANALLGGLPTSRLFANVREKQSLCYYCASSFASLKSTLTIDSGVEHANAQRASAAILHELKTLQTELVSEEELGDAQRAIKNALILAKDSPDAVANWVFNEQLRGTGLTLDEVAELIDAVTREEVRDLLASFTPVVEYVITGKE